MFHQILSYKKLPYNASFSASAFTFNTAENQKAFALSRESDPMQEHWRRR